MNSKIIQITILPEDNDNYLQIFALCSDSTIWRINPNRSDSKWEEINE